MTEDPLQQHAKPMCVRIWLEVGHACEPRRTPSGRALALDWRVWVRGARGDVSAFVHKVVFKLDPPSAFVYPKRVLQEPPYEIKESGCASLDIPIHVYLKFANKPKKIRLRYSLHIESNDKTNSASRCVYYDFENPSELLYTALMKGGGEVIARASKLKDPNNKLIVVFSDDERAKQLKIKSKRYKFVEPLRSKHESKRTKKFVLEGVCPKCGESIDADFRKQLQSVSMSDDEINHIAQLHLAYTCYEKSLNCFPLPPSTDPIYGLPELPYSLRSAVTSVKSDYVLQ